MLSEGVPAWRSLTCRTVSPSSAAGRPATGTSTSPLSTHCDSKRPQAAAPAPAAARARKAREALVATHGVELVAQAAPGPRDPLAQDAPAILVARMAVARRGDRLAPVCQVRGCGGRGCGSEHESENPAHAGILPADAPQALPSDRRPPLECREERLVGGVGREGIGAA